MLFDSLKSQTWLERFAIFLTTFLIPVFFFDVLDGLAATGPCWDCVDPGRAAIYFAMFVFALAVIAMASNVNESRAEKKLNQMSSAFNDSVNQLREDLERKFRGNHIQVSALDDWVSDIHRTLLEKGFDLPFRTVSGDAAPISAVGTMSAAVGVAPPLSRLACFRLWVKNQTVRFLRWYNKWIYSKDCSRS